MDATAVVCELAEFIVEYDAALAEDAYFFSPSFGGRWLSEWMHAWEEGAVDELTNGPAKMGVLFIVYVQHEIGQDCFLVFGGGGPVIFIPLTAIVRTGILTYWV